uniref:Uncharacterized protein n=1 Tax=Mycena chlorophos TaxID=658473 RepID=A0ABQ0LCQ5_MYCCL|nr:predicted protein [Mycena chlorophos]
MTTGARWSGWWNGKSAKLVKRARTHTKLVPLELTAPTMPSKICLHFTYDGNPSEVLNAITVSSFEMAMSMGRVGCGQVLDVDDVRLVAPAGTSARGRSLEDNRVHKKTCSLNIIVQR